jgi:hypothetical protein
MPERNQPKSEKKQTLVYLVLDFGRIDKMQKYWLDQTNLSGKVFYG